MTDLTQLECVDESNNKTQIALEKILELQNFIYQRQEATQVSFEQFTTKINNSLRNFEIKQNKIETDFNQASLKQNKMIDTMKQELLFLRHNTFLRRILRKLIRVQIGNLHQYPPKVLSIPKKYKKKLILNKYPTISIVTPSFNQGEFLEKTIKSVIDQNYPKLEYILQDGGSTDQTQEIIQRYQNKITHWESKKDNGQSEAINLGFKHATGEIMAYLNSDDLLLPGSLEYIANFFENHPKIDVVYGHRILIDENGFETGRWVLPLHCDKVLAWADYVPQETLFWRKKIWDKAGSKIDESFRFAMDWDLILRFRSAGAKFARLPRFLGAFRVHEKQKTSSTITEVGIEEMERLRTRCHGRKIHPVEVNKHIRTYKLKHLICHKLYQLGILRYD